MHRMGINSSLQFSKSFYLNKLNIIQVLIVVNDKKEITSRQNIILRCSFVINFLPILEIGFLNL